jgi:uncharacterized protein (DUF342 family)
MSQTPVKGIVEIAIDIAELEARLNFTPDPNGTEWSSESLYRAVLERQLSMVSQRTVDGFLQNAAKAKSPISEVIAKGLAPEQPQPETVEWVNIPIPDELKDIADEKVSRCPPPEFFRVKVEIVKKETIVRKPNPIPFMPPKEEKVVTEEKREKRVQIAYDTQILGFSLARKGEKIGTSFAPKPGKGGKNVFNRQLPAPQLEQNDFLLDPSLSRSGRDILAQRDGFLRYGKNWADICPFSVHAWSLSPSPDGMSLMLDYSPGDPRLPIPDAAQILAKAAEMGGKDLIDERTLDNALHEAAAGQEELCSYLLTTDKDAEIDISISEDFLKATLLLRNGRGRGRPLDLRVLSERIKTLGIKVKNPAKLKEDVLAFFKGPQSELKDYLLSEGTAPGAAKDRSLSLQVSFLTPDKTAVIMKRLEEQSAGLKDLKGLEEYPLSACQKIGFIAEGKQILSVSKLEPGTAGTDVFGKQIPYPPGKAPTVKCYDNLRFSADSATPLVDGIVMYREEGNVHYLRALPFRDAEVLVKIAPDILTASVSLFPGLGLGNPLTLEAVLAALKTAGIAFGVDESAIQAAIAETSGGAAVEDRIVARGKQARSPGSRKIDWKVQIATGKSVTVGSGGQADFRNQDKVTTVKEGDLIAALQKTGDSGESGMDVKGKKIDAPKPGAGDNVSYDSSVREEPGEGDTVNLVAARSGELRFEKNAISVVQAFSVKGNIDMKVGNLRFPGDVSVSGCVSSGFILVSGGNVAIGEGAEASLVSAEGMVRMGLGIKGQGKGTIRAKGMEMLFAEHATLLATEDIRIKNACVSCNVKTNGKLRLLSDKGHLLGGKVKAKGGIDVQTLGSETNPPTMISFGQDYLVFDLVESEQREIDKIKTALQEYENKMAAAEKHGDAKLAQLRQDKLKLLKLLEKRSMRLLSLNDQFEIHFPSEVRVRGTVYPGVVLESHNRTLEIRQQKSKVAFAFDSEVGRIVEKPLTAEK